MEMKKIITTISIALMLLTNAIAQNKNDIAIEYSQFTVPQGVYLIGGVFGAAFSLGNFSFDNTIFTGALGVEYNRNVNNWFSYGGYIGAEYITSDTYTMKDDVKTYNGGHYNLGFISIMPTCRFKWFTKEKIGMYSKVGVGVGAVFDNGDGIENNIAPTFQLSPICVDFGNSTLRGVCEIGFGMQGIVTLGIKKIW